MHLAEAILAHTGDESVNSPRRRWVMAGFARLMNQPGIDPMTRAAMGCLQCVMHNLKAEFDMSLELERRVRRWLSGAESSYATMAFDFSFGQVNMAQGRVQEAIARYQRVVKMARERLSLNLWQGAFGELLILELELERNRVPAREEKRLLRIWWHPAESDMAVELGREARGVDYALGILDKIREETRHSGPTLKRHLAGLRVALLAGAGRVNDAEAHWRDQALPQSFDGCVDLDEQSWREMEVISCARLRLCTARGEFEAGRRLVADVLAVARQRGLRRTEMRVLGQAITHEHTAGEPELAAAHLVAFLRLFAETDYARPMVRERASAVAVLTWFLETNPGSSHDNLAATLLKAVRAAESVTVPTLTAREFEVLRRLDTQTDLQIAGGLGLTRAGVRYHVQRLFAKLGVRGRKVAVERARSLDILPPEESIRIGARRSSEIER